MLKRYIQENRKSIFITVVFTVALYAVMLLGNRISIDTEVMINNPEGQLNAWYGINRFGLGLFKHVFHLIPISIPFTNVMTVLFFIFAAISWNYSLVTLQKVQNTKAVFVFLLIFVSSPIFAEQFHFTLQSMEIAFALGAEAIAVILVSRWVEKKGIYHAIAAVLLLAFCFSCYQAFVFLYVFACLLLYLIRQEEKETSGKEQVEEIFKYILVLLAAFVLYEAAATAIKASMGLESGKYLTNQILWGQEPVLYTLCRVIAYTGFIMTGFMSSFHPFLPVLYLFFAVVLYKKWQKKGGQSFLKLASLAGLMIVPFILPAVMGNTVPIRAQFCIPILLSWLGYFFVKSNEKGKIFRYARICVILMLVLQTIAVPALELSAWRCYEKDKAFAKEVEAAAGDIQPEEKLVFVGKYTPNHMIKGQTMGHSFFEWDADTAFGSNYRIHGFMETLGIKYQLPTQQEYEQARQYEEKLPSWKEKKAVYTENGLRIIKLSD